MAEPLPTPDLKVPGPDDPTLVLTVDPEGVTEHIAVWWDGTTMEHIAWVEIIFGPRNWRTTGERKEDVKSRPVALGRIEFVAPLWRPDPATLEIRSGNVPGSWVPVPHGVWLTGRRPYQPPVRISSQQVTGGDPALARMVDAVIEGKAESAMTIERKPADD